MNRELRRTTYTTDHLRDRIVVNLLRDRILSTIKQWTSLPGGKRLLDVGCGAQPFRAVLEEMGFDYHGIDSYEQPGVSLDATARIDETLAPSLIGMGPFDFLIVTEVMEHALDWPVTFDNLAKLLRPGGELLMTCPFFYPLHEEPADYWRPTFHGIAAMARRHGLEPVAIERLGSTAAALALLSSHLLVTFPYGTPRGLAHRSALFVVQRIVRATLRGIAALASARFFSSIFDGDQSIYLSNVARLRKTI